MSHRSMNRAGAVALVWAAVALPGAALAATGTLQERVLTFADQPANTASTIGFSIDNTVAVSGTVRLWMDFTGDSNNVVPPGAEPFVDPTKVSFALSYNAAVIWTFTAQDAVATISQSITTPPVDATGAKAGVGRYEIILNFPSGSSTIDKDWSLAIKDSGAVISRAMIYIEDKGHFKSLAPTGLCSVTSSPSCPVGTTCKGPCPFPPPYCVSHPWNCLREKIWIPVFWKWPPPGPDPCLCPDPWKEKFGEEFERTILSFVALNRDGKELGAGQAKQIQLNIVGGRAIGGLVDVGGGEYAQMLEVRKGEASPRVTATIAGATGAEFVAGPAAAEVKSPLTMVLGILLVLAVALAGYLASRNRGAGTRQG